MKVINARICSSGMLSEGEICIDGERIVSCGESRRTQAAQEGEEIIDAAGMYVIPGLIDVHFHGCVGYDVCDASEQALDRMAAYEGSQGVLGICPATMTYPEGKLGGIMDLAADYHSPEGAAFLGLHLEGPFINPQRVGAQSPDYVQEPNAQMFLRLQERAKGRIRICDVAPEMPGAMEFIREIRQSVSSVSLAHTCTDYETAMEAFAGGADHLTHGFNAMPGIHHRKPGPLAAAADSKADVELICDGVHIHPAAVRLAFRLFGDDHVILISDSMRACGLEDGCYDLGGQQVRVKGNLATLEEDSSVIAGSVTNLMDCLRCAVKTMGIPLESAVKAATHNPARSIGVSADYGDIEPGKYADLLILDQELKLVHMIQKGKLIR